MRQFWIDGQLYNVRLPSAEEISRCFTGVAHVAGDVQVAFAPLKQEGVAVWLDSGEYSEFGMGTRANREEVLIAEETNDVGAFCCLALIPAEENALDGVEEFELIAFGSVQRHGKEVVLSQSNAASGNVSVGNTPVKGSLQLRVMRVGDVLLSVPLAQCTFLEAVKLLEG